MDVKPYSDSETRYNIHIHFKAEKSDIYSEKSSKSYIRQQKIKVGRGY